MHALLDNLVAVLIGGIVLLIIAFIQFRGQEAAVGSVQYYAAKSQMVDFVRQLQVDVNSIGAGVPNAQIELGQALVGHTVSGDTTDVFAFRTYADSSNFPTKGATDVVCYHREPTGEIVHVWDPGTATYVPKPTFRIVRRLNPSSPGTCAGGTVIGSSLSTLTEFSLELRREDGTATNTFSEARQVYAHVRGVTPLGGGKTAHQGGMRQHIDETRWNGLFRPPNMTRYSP